jgi:hypothetical protein
MKRKNMVFHVFMLFIFLFAALSVSATPKPVPDKYNFDGKLERVDKIASFRQITLDKADKQAVILKANGDEYYLLILRKPIDNINLEIGIERTVPTIISGQDRVVVNENNTGPKYYMIDRIYRLKDKEQKEEIRELLKIKN